MLYFSRFHIIYDLFVLRKDCEDIWQKFVAGFAHQSQCNVSSAGFRDFVMATSHSVPNDKVGKSFPLLSLSMFNIHCNSFLSALLLT